MDSLDLSGIAPASGRKTQDTVLDRAVIKDGDCRRRDTSRLENYAVYGYYMSTRFPWQGTCCLTPQLNTLCKLTWGKTLYYQ